MFLPAIPNLPAMMSQPQQFGGSEFAPRDRWAIQTQGGAWTQIAPIPPPKPPMLPIRGRPSSASSVSRLVRQTAYASSRPQLSLTSQQGSPQPPRSPFVSPAGSPAHRASPAPVQPSPTPPQGATINVNVVDTLARHMEGSRTNSRNGSANLNETFNVDTTGPTVSDLTVSHLF